MIKLTEELREEFDFVLLDCPAGIEQGFRNAIAGADKALVVTTPEVSAIRDADRIIGLLEADGIQDIHLIINRLRPDMIARGDMMSVEDVVEILAVNLIGSILDDEQIVIAAIRENLFRAEIHRLKKNIETSAAGYWVRRSHLHPFIKKRECFRGLEPFFINDCLQTEGEDSCESFVSVQKPLLQNMQETG